MAEIIYRHRPVSRRAWLWPIVLWALATTGLLLGSKVELTGTQVGLAVFGPSGVFGIWLLSLAALTWRGTVTITRQTLRVGTDRVPVAAIEPDWVRMLAARATPELAARVGARAPQVAAERQADRRRGRLLGGAYGASFCDELVTLDVRNERTGRFERASLPARDRPGLLAGLLTALDQQA
ncbi:MAG TPA: hypothetical protein VG497_20085 [Kribbella sp.]|nr:hypothetical protein [Kribbella sp.]